MLKLIKSSLEQFINDIDSGNSHLDESEQLELLGLIQKITSQDLTKVEASRYINKSRATFDNYIKQGLIPEGQKRAGSNLKFWKKSDLDLFLKKFDK